MVARLTSARHSRVQALSLIRRMRAGVQRRREHLGGRLPDQAPAGDRGRRARGQQAGLRGRQQLDGRRRDGRREAQQGHVVEQAIGVEGRVAQHLADRQVAVRVGRRPAVADPHVEARRVGDRDAAHDLGRAVAGGQHVAARDQRAAARPEAVDEDPRRVREGVRRRRGTADDARLQARGGAGGQGGERGRGHQEQGQQRHQAPARGASHRPNTSRGIRRRRLYDARAISERAMPTASSPCARRCSAPVPYRRSSVSRTPRQCSRRGRSNGISPALVPAR